MSDNGVIFEKSCKPDGVEYMTVSELLLNVTDRISLFFGTFFQI